MKTFCAYYNEGICQSCDLMTLEYRDQIKSKESELGKALQGLKFPPFLPSVASKEFSFRNKAKLVVTGTIERPILGLWGKENLDEGRELLNCPLHVKELNEVLPVVKEFIQLAKLVPYNIESKKGELKGLILFYSNETKESYLRFVMRSKEAVSRIIKHQQFLLEKISHLKTISINIQPLAHAVLEGEEEVFITNNHSIHHKLNLVTMSLGPRAFVQTNQEVAKKLYETAASWVKELQTDRFLELFCGQGAFSFFCAQSIEVGLGIEINEAAIQEANLTAENFGLSHLKFKSADAGKVGKEIEEFHPSLILVNPPRRGLADTTHLLLDNKPHNIIYSSCSYETLAKDLGFLTQAYEIEKIQIFDMFPQTKHFETLVLLKRKTT